ncbi:MAG: GNAT family N-acetyltransferase [Flavobacteriaceae bacterium]|nr:GNAT family N-acetyltransferase [Flavobacteriaceae bacterium]
MNNPFTSQLFNDIWLKHFNDSKTAISFKCIANVKFIKRNPYFYFVNVGKNLTKGIYYSLNTDYQDFKNKVFLIYDVPSYFKVVPPERYSKLKLKRVFQYKGFLMNLDGFTNSEEYIKSRFSGKNRREFRSNQRRLETCFNIDYKFIIGQINESDFKLIFDQFHDLLSIRFYEKQTDYHHLGSQKWNYYSDLVFKCINDNKASLLVVYKDDTPIGITLNFHADSIIFETITVFDPDYYKFSIGKTSIIKLLDWCFENNIQISDFSKGDFEYKNKWGNEIYDFEYHILYDSRSIIANLIASMIAFFFKFKLYLRKKNLNAFYRKLRFILGKGKKQTRIERKFQIEKLSDFEPDSNYKEVDITLEQYNFLKKFLYSFLFANPEPEALVKVYKNNSDNDYIIMGSKAVQKISFDQ